MHLPGSKAFLLPEVIYLQQKATERMTAEPRFAARRNDQSTALQKRARQNRARSSLPLLMDAEFSLTART
ncbi:hypothetical protein [Bradyrhizobium erythrophlei]|jgi:hypothetical protein|uniref:hypothetical protein n=1 Tax=Bradyrhizobium erythrophlei TaxID=1437360 RepID=UPI0012EB902F|nr:hypothetical protein [Bradyrhizobium erythrophlei]